MEVTQTLDRTLDKIIAQFRTPGTEIDPLLIHNPIELLENQHREVDTLFAEIENLGDRAIQGKQKLVNRLIETLAMHTTLEEKCFYPVAKKYETSSVLECFEEHDAMKTAMNKLKRTKPNHESFNARIKFLKGLVQNHVKAEENNIFPYFKSTTDEDELDQMTAGMRRILQRKMTVKKPSRSSRRSSMSKKQNRGHAAVH